MAEIVETRWRAVIEVEFTTRDYEGQIEEYGARSSADHLARGADRAELDVNSRRAGRARVLVVGRVVDDG